VHEGLKIVTGGESNSRISARKAKIETVGESNSRIDARMPRLVVNEVTKYY
jgi:hypothetical protein